MYGVAGERVLQGMRSRWGSVGKDGDNNQDNRGTGNSTNIFTYSSLLNNVHLNSMGPLKDFFFPQEIRYYTICNSLSPARNIEPQIKRVTVKVYSDF